MGNCEFTAVGYGTGNFVVGAATAGHATPENSNVIDGKTYTYYAASADVTQWEAGSGPYTVATHTLKRTSITANSNGDLNPVNFTAAPIVGVSASPSFSLESLTSSAALLKAFNFSDLANLTTALTNLGLQNVNNTSDVNKPISTAQAAINSRITYAVDYGVIANNLFDNSTTLAAAYTAAAGGTLILPIGNINFSTTQNWNTASTRVIGAGRGSTFLNYTTASGAAIKVNSGAASYQYFADFQVDSTIAASSRTGPGIWIALGAQLTMERVNSHGHQDGILTQNAANLTLNNVWTNNNSRDGRRFDAWVGGANTGNIQETHDNYGQSLYNLGWGYKLIGGASSTSLLLNCPGPAFNTLGGICVVSGDAGGLTGVNDLKILSAAGTGNGSTDNGIDLSGNVGGTTISINGPGFLEFFNNAITTIGQGFALTGPLNLLQSTTGLLLNGTGGTIFGVSFGGCTTNIELGASSSGYNIGTCQGIAGYGASTNGFKIDGGAGAVTAIGVDFGSSTNPFAIGSSWPTGSMALGAPYKVPMTNGQILVGQSGFPPSAVALTGDATLSAPGALTLASTITAGGPTGSATVAPIITYDAKGRLTAVSSATITPAASSITGTLAASQLGIAASVLTNSLGSNTALGAANTWTVGPTVAQGASGTWLAFGTVTMKDPTAAIIGAKLWDGTTVIASSGATITAAAPYVSFSLCGILATPAGNIRISCVDFTNSTGTFISNDTGGGKDSTLTVMRIG
jgi:hypothetical protein